MDGVRLMHPNQLAFRRNLCSLVAQVAELQRKVGKFGPEDSLTIYLSICKLAEAYDAGIPSSTAMTPSKRVHELSDDLIESFLDLWLSQVMLTPTVCAWHTALCHRWKRHIRKFSLRLFALLATGGQL